jgi:hypothetical protein
LPVCAFIDRVLNVKPLPLMVFSFPTHRDSFSILFRDSIPLTQCLKKSRSAP